MSEPVEVPLPRWAAYEVVYTADGERFTQPANAVRAADGPYVTYADHVAAVQAERERIRAVIDDGLPREWFDVKAAVLAVIDGASDE